MGGVTLNVLWCATCQVVASYPGLLAQAFVAGARRPGYEAMQVAVYTGSSPSSMLAGASLPILHPCGYFSSGNVSYIENDLSNC